MKLGFNGGEVGGLWGWNEEYDGWDESNDEGYHGGYGGGINEGVMVVMMECGLGVKW